MKNTGLHSKPGALFSQCDYRWILESSTRKGRDVSSCESIL